MDKLNELELNVDRVMNMLDMRRNQKGDITGPRATLDNIDIVLENDVRIAGKLGYDVVAGRPTINEHVYWDNDLLAAPNQELHPLLGDKRYLTDHDVAEIQRFVQKDYGQKLPDIEKQIQSTAKHHCFDPIKNRLEYLGSQYDGGEYIKQLMPHFLGVVDDEYQRDVMFLTMIAFIERQYNPGRKYDCVLAITGDTGVGKTTWVQRLAFWDLAYYASITDDIQTKDVKQIVAAKRIIEFGEMMSLQKSKKEALKDFLSARQETFRNPYDRMFTDAVRKNIFIATTNEIDFLTDPTSSRRWLIVESSKDRVKDITEILRSESQELFDKAWGEAYCYWLELKKDKSLSDNYLMDLANSLADEASKHAEMHYEYDPMQGMIIEYLDRKLENGEKTVCVKEILDFVDLGNGKRYERRDIAAILDNACKDWKRADITKRCGKYGPQRCWEYTGEMPEVRSEKEVAPVDDQERLATELEELRRESDLFM